MKGRFNPREQSYDAAIRADSFPLNSFLPADSLGIVDLTLQARGTGFDPLLPRTRTSLRAQIDRAEFGGRDFGASNSTQNSTASVFQDGSPTATRRSGCCCPSPER